jgi:rhodanese-related sulfurtransferase
MLSAVAVSCSAGGTAGWTKSDLIQPKDLAAILSSPGSVQPVLLHVGFRTLFRSHHIPHSVYAGPSSKQEGRDLLKSVVASLPKDREIVVYCGCCPWSHCPNVKPAVDVLHGLGYQHVKALMIETNLSQEWVRAGYPIESGQDSPQR